MWTLGAGGSVGFAGVAAGAAVVTIVTTDRLWQGTAAPFVSLAHEAAGCVPGAAGVGVAHVSVRSRQTGHSLGGRLLQGCDLLEPGQADISRLVTSLLSHITLISFGAAVLVIITANSLR